MKISVLVENSVNKSDLKDLRSEHGLSLFIESGEKKILFDTGQSDLFIHNASKMGIDLSQVDYLVISHGHFDHGGGLKHFLKINKKAKIFLHRNASNKFYTMIFGMIPYYIGLNQNIIARNTDRIFFIDEETKIGDMIVLIEGFPEVFPQPESNKPLFEKKNRKLMPDKFRHELAMEIIENDEIVLFSGCSHSGVINIIEKTESHSEGKRIKAVFGGFHIHNPINKRNESSDYIKKLTKSIKETGLVFYTGHCTGETNFGIMKEELGNKIQTMNTGEVIYFS